MLRAVTIAVVGLLAIGGAQATSEVPSPFVRPPAPRAVLTQLVQAVGGSASSVDATRYRYLRKLDGHLQDVAASRLGGGTPADAAAAAAREAVTITPADDVLVDVYVTGDVASAATRLRALGMRVTATSDRVPERMVEGYLPSGALPQAAALGATRAVISASGAGSGTGSITSQGDAVINGPQARAGGIDGTGVSVGIISDSINEVGGGISASQATGDLPPSVTDLVDDPAGVDEGRAMAEIVYDEAPGISGISFASGILGAASKASSIDQLVQNGVKVIADDIFYRNEPFFQDGIVSQAVDRAKAAGVAYFALAGNEADHSWEGTYSPVPDPSATARGLPASESTEDFDPSGSVDTVQSVGTVPAGGIAYISLQWAEPWTHATSDFAVDVYDTSVVPATFEFTIPDTNNIVTGIPAEFGGIANHGATSASFGIAIRRVAGTGTPFLKYIDFTNGSGTVNIEHPTHSNGIAPDAGAAKGAFTVAATSYTTPTTPESFSSRGPVTRLFDAAGTPLLTPELRQKPDAAGPDGVSTSVPGSFAHFFGTSAATPAVAGIAALLLSSNRTLSVDQLYSILRNPANTQACTTAQPAIDCGAGLVLADKAVEQGRDKTPPVVTPIVSPPAPDGTNGWYTGPVSVAWSETDPESPILNPGVCVTTSIPDGGATLTCSATSIGGTTSVPITLARDATPPSAPVISGIAAQTYEAADAPDGTTIGCASSDDRSGVVSCVVSGFDLTPGAHRLTATATNGAGLTSTSTLDYVIAAPPAPQVPPPATPPKAITGLAIAPGSLAAIAGSGVGISLQAAAPGTRVAVTLVARVPRASGQGTKLVTVGTLTTSVGKGVAHLRVKLSASGKRALARLHRATLTITVRGSGSAARSVSLQRSVVVSR